MRAPAGMSVLVLVVLAAMAGTQGQLRWLQLETLQEGLSWLLGSPGSPDMLRRSRHGASFWVAGTEKFQDRIADDVPFPCPTEGHRSPEAPSSVHRLRPGDIDVVAAMGDSLTAGNGIAGGNVMQVLIENKGMSWSIGGQATWREFLTLPNILKEYNPRLIGYCDHDTWSQRKDSQFNVAEAMATSADMPRQARLLVERIVADPSVDMLRHWKMVTIFIGANDFCLGMCYRNVTAIPRNCKSALMKALDYLQANLPRTFVSLVATKNMEIATRVKGRPLVCKIMGQIMCPCLVGYGFSDRQQEFKNIMDQVQRAGFELVDSGRYNKKKDFTVVMQPFTVDSQFIEKETPHGTVTDFSYFAADCFHFSQKSHAKSANSLWNNLLEPVGKKTTAWDKPFRTFKCPTPEQPYFYTSENSGAQNSGADTNTTEK
ncbi:phospholipase B1, membrane-associated-like [Bacillus rossius redtenbacheri]|uniref:phospholipase B1, membrane-associated-like n=1 Tax=Bacillus rossius redtenbacheri TaxID=93214 RepID=UPI002FDD40C8